jgi:hypothetical protein
MGPPRGARPGRALAPVRCRGLEELPSRPTWPFPPRPWTSHLRWIAPSLRGAEVLCGIELGGVVRSPDGGEAWDDRRPARVGGGGGRDGPPPRGRPELHPLLRRPRRPVCRGPVRRSGRPRGRLRAGEPGPGRRPARAAGRGPPGALWQGAARGLRPPARRPLRRGGRRMHRGLRLRGEAWATDEGGGSWESVGGPLEGREVLAAARARLQGGRLTGRGRRPAAGRDRRGPRRARRRPGRAALAAWPTPRGRRPG